MRWRRWTVLAPPLLTLAGGLALGFAPEAGVGAVAAVGVVATARGRRADRAVEWAALAFALSLAWLRWRSSGTLEGAALGLLEGVFGLALLRGGAWLLAAQGRAFGSGVALGLVGAVAWAAYAAAFLPPPAQPWEPEPSLVRLERPAPGVERFVPVHPENAWVTRPLGTLGPGRIEYQLEARGDRPAEVVVSLISNAATDRRDVRCEIGTIWRTCQVAFDLPAAKHVVLGFGGYGAWRAGGATIDVRAARLHVAAPLWLERLAVPRRVAGLAFNPNALAAWAAVLAVLALGSQAAWPLRLAALAAGGVGVFLSGGRGGFLALLVAVPLAALARLRWPANAVAVLALTLAAGAIGAGRLELPLGRLATTFEGNAETTLDRLQLFRLAGQAFLESPLVGIGNLPEYMAARADGPSGAGAGARAPEATHAHNLLLQVAGSGGLVALAGLLAVWGAAIVRALRCRDAAALVVLAAVALLNLGDYLFFYAPVQAAFWLAAAGIAPAPPAEGA